MAVVGAGDFALVSFVDDNVEQLPSGRAGCGRGHSRRKYCEREKSLLRPALHLKGTNAVIT